MAAKMRRLTVGIVALLFSTTLPMFAIEGLQISVQCSNVVLSWPSTNDETYIVQYRSTLDASTPRQTLTTSLPADVGTNLTFYVHSNIVLNPNCGGGGSYAAMSASTNGMDSVENVEEPPLVPMAIPANGTGSAAPLALYPVGFDMSGFVIFDPVTGETVSGAGYSNQALSPLNTSANDLEPMDEPVLDGGTLAEPDTGFYRVVRNGAHIYGMTNGMILSGTVQLPIELGVDSTNEIAGVTFYANGTPLIGALAEGVGYYWKLDWDTTMRPNGNYDITAQVDFTTDNSTTNMLPVTVTVNNAISFPNYFTRIYGDEMWIYAELATPVANFQLDMYDENTNSLGAFTGSTSDGVISFLWDLTDGNGYTFDNTNFYGVFTVSTSSLNLQSKAQANGTSTNPPSFQKLAKGISNNGITSKGVQPNGAGSSTSAPQFWVKESRWTFNDKWVVAYGPLDNSSYNNDAAVNMIVGGVAANGTLGGVLGTLDLYGLSGNLSPGNSAQGGTVFTLSNATAKTNLLSYLANQQFKNFYFFGHGSPSAIGGYQNRPAVVHQNEIADALLNVPLSYPSWPWGSNPTMMQRAAMHPYRLVFIDACNAGAGKFCEAFGIPAQTVNNQFFYNAKVEARAFVGFTGYKNFNAQQWRRYCEMTQGFYGDWLENRPLNVCVSNALNGVHTENNYLKMDPSVVIYGAADLTHNITARP